MPFLNFILTLSRDMVDKLRQALDESEILSTPDLISSETSSKDFDAFLRSIDKCATLAQAKRLRNDVDLGIRRSTIELRRGITINDFFCI